jgi:dipeptidyl aminopeptidase/acylaminoacyl peptidase
MIRNILPVLILGLAACSESPAPSEPGPDTTLVLTGFQLTGDPASPNGATWTYRDTVDGVVYDLQGFIRKPAGNGPFPAVILSHGAGGSANGYSRGIANVMVSWGLVCIATNYTHAGSNVPVGLPGTAAEPGASAANVQRARGLIEILRSLGYVDLQRVAAHGHSMGAFVTTALLGAHPDLFRVASHTAGGARPDFVTGPAPAASQVTGLRTPYQLHHGDADVVVPLSSDQRLATLLVERGVTHELVVYPGATHSDVANNTVVLERIRNWYTTHGLF